LRYVQGKNATRELGAQLVAAGIPGPAYLVASARAAGSMAKMWQASFGAVGMDYVVGSFGGECSDDEIERGAAAARQAGAGVVIGVGGGKALDTSRAIAGILGVAAVNCPTLASSDAPCSALSVVYTPDGVFDRIIYYPRNPSLVLVDTAIVAAAPRRHLVSGMGDALATWFEARTVIEARTTNAVHGMSTLTAAALAELCCRTLLADGAAAAADVEVGAVTPALERIVEANTLLSGLGFESGGLAIAHAVHNGLTTAPATHAYMHGEKVSFGLVVQLVVEGRPITEITEVVDFCQTVGLPTTLGELGLAAEDREALRLVAERTVAPGESAHNEPFEVTSEMILDGILAADRFGSDRRRG
jgi:glycerol dehydrogenase